MKEKSHHFVEFVGEKVNPWEDYHFNQPQNELGQKFRAWLKKLYLWSQKAYKIRYLPVLSILKNQPADLRILEVGSGALGLARYSKRKIVGLDICVDGPHYENMSLINAQAWNLPFQDGTFDIVVSVDMLEHIPREFRAQVLAELLRVARQKVVLGCPLAELAEEWESKARGIYDRILKGWQRSQFQKEKFIKRNSFLQEHHEYRLPREHEVLEYIQHGQALPPNVKVICNENIYVWYWAVLGNMKYNYYRWFLTTITLLLFFPILSRVTFGKTYRRIFVVDKGRKGAQQ